MPQANTWQDPSPDIIDDANDEIEDNTCPDITDDDGDDECEDYFASFADTDKIWQLEFIKVSEAINIIRENLGTVELIAAQLVGSYKLTTFNQHWLEMRFMTNKLNKHNVILQFFNKHDKS